MNKELVELIDKCKRECLEDVNQPKEVMLQLMSIDPFSEEAQYARDAACEATHTIRKDRGNISFSVGIDYTRCTMGCKFCTFGNGTAVIPEGEEIVIPDDRIVEKVRQRLQQGCSSTVLRTTESFPHDHLVALTRRIRTEIPGKYGIVINTGELDAQMCEDLYEAGATSACHFLRLREGIDTNFDPETRLATMRAIAESKLEFITGIDPVGPEHTNEEIADLLVLTQSFKPSSICIQARCNVEGTPFENAGLISEERQMLLVAVARLTTGCHINSIGCHPHYAGTLYSGGGGYNIEWGAVPRDAEFSEDDWEGFTYEIAKKSLEDAGFWVQHATLY